MYGNEPLYQLPVIFHNLKSYDSHVIVKNFKKEYVQRMANNGKVSYDDLHVTAQNPEKFISFNIGPITFLDSCLAMPSSLDNLVSALADGGNEKFVETRKYVGADEKLFKKGIFPYTYMTGPDKLLETQLPPIEAFYNDLTDQPLSVDDYARAQEMWTFFDCRTMSDYQSAYLTLDTLLLADTYQSFRNAIYNDLKLESLHFLTLPSLSWSAALKMTKAKVELLTDPLQWLMIEGAMRGGISVASTRYARGDEIHDPENETTFIAYWDMNNLYGHSLSQSMPIGGWKWLTKTEIDNFDVTAIADDSDVGYIVEVDLEYPRQLHDKHSSFPLAPEHLEIKRDMLSTYQQSFFENGLHWRPCTKLAPNLYDKHNYVTHYRNLKFYVQQGMVITKIHKILSFKQSPWLLPWLKYCTERRTKARSTFESDMYKLMANSVFGKSCESQRHHRNFRLISDPKKVLKAVSKVSMKSTMIINEDLCLVESMKSTVKLNRPIFIGFTVLELSKLHMYDFYYNYMAKTYASDKFDLCYIDTDSFIFTIATKDLHVDMTRANCFDTSNFPPDHTAYNPLNKKVVGKMKSETGAEHPLELIALRSKMYSLLVSIDQETKMTAKGIKKSFVHKNLKHEQYIETLRNRSKTTAQFNLIRSKNHVLRTVRINKDCLSAFDDKRYILSDGIRTLAYGHYKIINGEADLM